MLYVWLRYQSYQQPFVSCKLQNLVVHSPRKKMIVIKVPKVLKLHNLMRFGVAGLQLLFYCD